MKLVDRWLPLNRTSELLTKFEPMTVRLKPALPVNAVAGSMLLTAGIGLLPPAGARQLPYSPGTLLTIAWALTNPNGGVTPGKVIEKLTVFLRIGIELSCCELPPGFEPPPGVAPEHSL